VAICESPGGQYEYRGVRVRDGAKLIISATRSSDGKFVAENDGITYTVTPRSLVVSVGTEVIRTEPMVDYHGRNRRRRQRRRRHQRQRRQPRRRLDHVHVDDTNLDHAAAATIARRTGWHHPGYPGASERNQRYHDAAQEDHPHEHGGEGKVD